MTNTNFLNQPLDGYFGAALTFCAVVVGISFLKWLIITLLKESNEPASIKYVTIKIVKNIGAVFYVVFAADAAIHFLPNLPWRLLNAVDKISEVVGIFYILLALGFIVDYVAILVSRKQLRVDPQASPTVTEFLSRMIKFAFWVIGFLSLLSNFGYNITALLTGLGIGGVAVAFALQNVLADVFASMSIYFDQPFRVGDFIVIGSDMGSVTKIGIKSTRLQTLEGQELIISNKELTSLHINNYKRMSRRRVVFGFGVPLNTATEQVAKIPDMVANIISSQEKAKVDRVHFSKIDTNQFSFEAVYFLDNADHNFYMDTQQKINLEMLGLFRKQDINLAFPAQTVFIRQ